MITIEVDDLSGPEIATFLEEHIADMKSVSPPESKHALDLEGLRSPDVTFWSLKFQNQLAGCAALKTIDSTHGEIKSMRTSSAFRGQGIASKLLIHLIEEAKSRSYQRLSLETGSMPFFEPARKLYQKFGFIDCPPFSQYKEDPNSVFMTLELE
ncbi:GNAT family N-acetyltransferase [Pelagicoccus mobilis]|uniref:GNAT family N-acetyltransferase n=1 Tax=Pelagicoccus mobilis TaxID=415221 RepID=A0A934VP09_9BACT|nr:GNAT family N-acetyltransferase [Pelagicoccus mobilis]MBK1876787.1 GNAT family N-acetyltransferase [Pelagicoccus mobilis]